MKACKVCGWKPSRTAASEAARVLASVAALDAAAGQSQVALMGAEVQARIDGEALALTVLGICSFRCVRELVAPLAAKQLLEGGRS